MRNFILLFGLLVLVGGCSKDSTTNPQEQNQWVLIGSHAGDSLVNGGGVNWTIESIGILNAFGSDSVRLKVKYRGWLNPNGIPPGGINVRKKVPPGNVTESYLNIEYFQDSTYRQIDSVMTSHNINAEYEYALALYAGNGYTTWIQFKDLEIYKK